MINEILRAEKITRQTTNCVQGLSIEQATERIANLATYQTTLKRLIERSQDKAVRSELFAELKKTKCALSWHEDMLERNAEYSKWLREASELGARFQDRTFGTLDDEMNKNVWRECREYANDFALIRSRDKNGLILSGDVGTGKTHLAAAIGNYLIDNHGVRVFFQNIPAMLNRIKNEFGKADFTLYQAKTSTLLILDDLGKEKQSEWVDEKLYEIVNARYESKLPIIVTTNLTGPALMQRLDKSVVSRLLETCKFVQVDGKDRRIW